MRRWKEQSAQQQRLFEGSSKFARRRSKSAIRFKDKIIVNALRPWRARAGLAINGTDQPKVRACPERVIGLLVVPIDDSAMYVLGPQAVTFFNNCYFVHRHNRNNRNNDQSSCPDCILCSCFLLEWFNQRSWQILHRVFLGQQSYLFESQHDFQEFKYSGMRYKERHTLILQQVV